MRMLNRFSVLVLGLAVLATSARADGSRSWNVCGGNTFNTCASVNLTVTGTTVTMQVWNLSGTNGTYGGTVFTGVGLFNVPDAVSAVAGQVTMSGPSRTGDNPSAWWVTNDKQIGGGINLDMVAQSNDGTGAIDNSIANNCLLGALPNGKNDLWMNPTCGTGSVTNPGTNGGFVVFSFQVTSTWDPDAEGTELLVKGQNGPHGWSTECITGTGKNSNCGGGGNVAPEPVSMALLGTGLMGLSGVGFLRRRRRNVTES